MKPTIKVSIGGFAFILEEDAYLILEEYLKNLQSHFNDNSEREEILSDVEARIAELFRMRMNDIDKTVSISDVETIISIIGSPKDFADKETEEAAPNKTRPFDFLQKKLYRDADHGILGGVCSGLGHYFRIDPVIIRVIFVAILFIFNFSSHSFGFSVVVAYLLLWIIMPQAKTLTQKLTMLRTDPSLEGIESRMPVNQKRTSSSIIVKLLKVFVGIVLAIISLCLLSMLAGAIAFSFGYNAHSSFPSLNDILDVFALNSFELKFALATTLILPLLVVWYICVKLLFQFKFSARDAVVLVLAFILWIGAAFYMGGIGLSIAENHKENTRVIQEIPIETASNTIYIKLDQQAAAAKFSDEDNKLSFIKGNDGNFSLFLVPELIIKKDSTIKSAKMEVEKRAFGETKQLAFQRAEAAVFNYTLSDSLIIIHPTLYNKENQWDKTLFKIVFRIPYDKNVKIEEPLRTDYW